LSTKTARIVEIGIILVCPGNEGLPHVVRYNPGIPISQGASKIHGIFDADVVNLKRFGDSANELLSFLDGLDICGFEINRFDLPILQAEFARVGLSMSLQDRAIVDVMTIFHDCVERQPGMKRDLAAAVRLYPPQSNSRSLGEKKKMSIAGPSPFAPVSMRVSPRFF
jgi:DNA polymerase III subunit epsilon